MCFHSSQQDSISHVNRIIIVALIGVSICWAPADSGKLLSVFDSSALKSNIFSLSFLLIFEIELRGIPEF